MVESHRMPEYVCPYCGEILDGATAVDSDYSEPPADGSVGICINCRSVMIYEGGQTRKPNDEEIIELAGDEELLKGMKMLGHYDEFIKSIGAKRS